MTYRQALKTIGNWMPGEKLDTIKKMDALAIAMDAINLQIPKKPKNVEITLDYGLVEYDRIGFCPNCGSICDNSADRCSRCGQALDWRIDDEIQKPKDGA